MTIDDQIRDEKLQYDINRETAKISALSSDKNDKYEYLTGQEILPSNRQQMIEQAKFTYSPLGKAFEKQIKTIEDQGQKQVEALNTLKSNNKLAIKGKSNNNQSKALEIFKDLVNERKSIMNKLHDMVDYNNLKFSYATLDKYVSFYEYMNFKELFDKIKNNKITYDNALEKQELFLKKLNDVKIGGKNDEQKKIVNNFKNFYKSREDVFNFFKDYPKMMIDSNYKAKQDETEGTRLKISTPKQMLQRLPIAVAQIKAGNNSQSLLNEIKQIVYSLYQSKEITKKVYNNIIKSIQ